MTDFLASTTKLRSTLTGAVFLALGLATIIFNVVTLFIRSSDGLAILSFVMVLVVVVPSWCCYVETPKYLYKKGQLTRMIDSLHRIATVNNREEATRYKIMKPIIHRNAKYKVIENKRIRVEVLKRKGEEEASKKSAFQEFLGILRVSRNRRFLFIFIIQGSALMLILFGMDFSVQSFGLNSINSNGVLYGAALFIGNMVPLPIAHEVPRKRVFMVCQSISIFSAVLLGILSQFEKTTVIGFLETLITTSFIAITNNCQYYFFYIYMAESFDTAVSGRAIAVITFVSRIVASSFPFIKDLSQVLGYHVICGCCFLTLIALPVNVFLGHETLEPLTEEDYLAVRESSKTKEPYQMRSLDQKGKRRVGVEPADEQVERMSY